MKKSAKIIFIILIIITILLLGFSIAIFFFGNEISYALSDSEYIPSGVGERKNSYVITLDLKGKQYTSEEFSRKINNISLNNSSSITFIIGGTLGLSDKVLKSSNELICFSKMTFPHQLIRIFLLEQIFRAFKISNNETYHR